MEEIVNKVANSSLLQIELSDFAVKGQRAAIDIKPLLWQELALKEKDFRDWVKNHDWEQYAEKHVAVFCSSDAIIPNWAYMLIASSLSGIAETISMGTPEVREQLIFKEHLQMEDLSAYFDKKVIVKGCSDGSVPATAFVDLTNRLVPIVASLMFGEACSTVPVYKRPK